MQVGLCIHVILVTRAFIYTLRICGIKLAHDASFLTKQSTRSSRLDEIIGLGSLLRQLRNWISYWHLYIGAILVRKPPIHVANVSLIETINVNATRYV